MDAVVFGNVVFDIICYPVNEVPRRESIRFDQVALSPGGCGSNTAVGLAALGVPTGLVAHTGDDEGAGMLFRYWERFGVDTCFVQRMPGMSTGTSVGLVDSDFQPRFVHTSGANATLTNADLDPQAYVELGAKFLHVAGFFVLPGVLDPLLAQKLAQARDLGMRTSMDVVFNVRMEEPDYRAALWGAMPHLDYFFCNDHEASRLSGEHDYKNAVYSLMDRGAQNVIIKLGSEGCYVTSDSYTGIVPGLDVDVVDTTGAGDAFASGFIAALSKGADIKSACEAGNQAGAKICTKLGPIAAWMDTQ
jgi:sugar/nucleoside kinase (ribokinase family)